MKDCSWVSPDFILDPHNTQSCHSASYQFTLPQHTMPQLKPVLTSSDIGLLAVTVSQSQLFTTSSLTQYWPVERFRAHVEICLPQLSLIFHTSVWRIGGVDLWPTTENTLIPAGGHTLVWGFKLKTLWLFSGHGAMVCVCARNVHIEKIIKACVIVSSVGVYCCSLILRHILSLLNSNDVSYCKCSAGLKQLLIRDFFLFNSSRAVLYHWEKNIPKA